ncbi:hypothetical protein [Ferruginibacter sp. HRS2-29]|uniref:hypothetical protein n=1 Tax=Ferruginibacter sp. HRS2-29 TaxID=2487334 RepID=UPI0020CE453D|nr:hypothetical protein [Ferruginibacter sp. HRS2-29]MCP9750540.1 hypothetical protein [Ferruginibacter sp. HRS2-29]
MRFIIFSVFFMGITLDSKCQDQKDIILQYTGDAVSIRKMNNNHPLLYSEANFCMITSDYDQQMNSDSLYYLVKPQVTVFKLANSESSKIDTVVRILFYYDKKIAAGQITRKEVQTFSNASYNLSPPAKVVRINEANQNKIHYVLDYRNKKSDFIVDGIGTKDASIFFVYTDKDFPTANYALMITNIKAIIVDGKKLQ